MTNKIFENIILVLIILSSLTLAYQSPYVHGGPNTYATPALVLAYMDVGFLAIFSVEMLAKHVARLALCQLPLLNAIGQCVAALSRR